MYKWVMMAIVVAPLSGCWSIRDISTGEETALIKAKNNIFYACTILPIDVRPKNSYSMSLSLIVDAGPIKIGVSCTDNDPFGDSFTERAEFEFIAEGGHTYTVVWGEDCMELLDATAGGSAVACEPYE